MHLLFIGWQCGVTAMQLRNGFACVVVRQFLLALHSRVSSTLNPKIEQAADVVLAKNCTTPL